MTTLARATRRPMVRVRATRITNGLGRAPYVLSIALAVDAVFASVGSLIARDVLRGPAVSIGSLQGTALTIVVVGLPVLLVSMALAARGSARALIGWLGALGFVAYQGVLFLFATPFNAFFFTYVAMLSLSIWSIVALLIRVPVGRLAERFDARMPVWPFAVYLLVNAGLFLVLWLGATVPAVLSPDSPTFLEGTGMTTAPVQIIDFAFTLPLMGAAAVWLWGRRPWGYLLTGGLLVMLTIETTSIGVDQWFGHAADPASPVASADLVPVFAVMTTLGLAVASAFLHGLSASAAEGAGLSVDIDLSMGGPRPSR
jgi:hypothetical protein